MVYIMLTGWVPAEKARVFGKRILEGIRKFPTDESVSKLIVQAAGTSNGCIRAFSISEVVDGKITEAITRASNFAIFYAEGVGEEFKYNVEILMSAMEAMRVIGLEMPE